MSEAGHEHGAGVLDAFAPCTARCAARCQAALRAGATPQEAAEAIGVTCLM